MTCRELPAGKREVVAHVGESAVVGEIEDVGPFGDVELVDRLEHPAEAGVEIQGHRGDDTVAVALARLQPVHRAKRLL